MKLTPKNKVWLENEGYFDLKETSRGVTGLCRMLYTVGLAYGIDETSLQGRYCFHSTLEARVALDLWDGEGDPSGNWIKHKGVSGEYGNPHYVSELSENPPANGR